MMADVNGLPSVSAFVRGLEFWECAGVEGVYLVMGDWELDGKRDEMDLKKGKCWGILIGQISQNVDLGQLEEINRQKTDHFGG